MQWCSGGVWFASFAISFDLNQADKELDREVASHLTLLQDDFIRQGMSADDAFRAAKRAYGGIEQVKGLQREERSWFWLE